MLKRGWENNSMLKKIYALLSKKYKVMSILWNAKNALSFNEILEQAGNIRTKKLKTIINKLIKKNYIDFVDNSSGTSIKEILYYPNISDNEYYKDLLFSNNDIFCKSNCFPRLTPEELEELKRYFLDNKEKLQWYTYINTLIPKTLTAVILAEIEKIILFNGQHFCFAKFGLCPPAFFAVLF